MTHWLYLYARRFGRTRNGPPRYGRGRVAFNGAPPARSRDALRRLGVVLAAVWAIGGVPASLYGTALAANDETVIVAIGDSLTAGFGVVSNDSFPVRLEAALRDAGLPVRVVNAGVSGDTSAGGLARLDWVLAGNPDLRPDLVIVELGANDGLRGLDPADMEANLDAILIRLADQGVAAVLTGMVAPPNMGRAYGEAFNAVFPRLAKQHGVVFYPFFLDGVAARPALNQPDGIHPNAAGVRVIVERFTPHVLRALAEIEQRAKANGR